MVLPYISFCTSSALLYEPRSSDRSVSTFTTSSGSVFPNSCLRIFSFFSADFTKLSTSSGSIPTYASALLGIALSLRPPCIDISLYGTSLPILYRSLASCLSAFALCFMISTPECPPVRPSTIIFTTK